MFRKRLGMCKNSENCEESGGLAESEGHFMEILQAAEGNVQELRVLQPELGRVVDQHQPKHGVREFMQLD